MIVDIINENILKKNIGILTRNRFVKNNIFLILIENLDENIKYLKNDIHLVSVYDSIHDLHFKLWIVDESIRYFEHPEFMELFLEIAFRDKAEIVYINMD